MGKGQDSDYDKGKIPVVIFDTYIYIYRNG